MFSETQNDSRRKQPSPSPTLSNGLFVAPQTHDLKLRLKLTGELSDQKLLERPWHPNGHLFKYDE
jgi:hypothetical protein